MSDATPVGDYDHAARFAIKIDPIGNIRWMLPGLGREWGFGIWHDTQTIPFPGEPGRRCDTVARLDHRDGLAPPWALVMEAQTRPDYDLIDRVLEYLGRLRRELRHGPHGRDRYHLGAVLLNLTGPAPPGTLEMVLPGTPLSFRWGIEARALGRYSAADTLADIAAGRAARCVLAWVALMVGAAEPANIQEWKRLASEEPDERRRASYAVIAKTFAELTGSRPIWERELEGWSVEKSPLLEEYRVKYRKEGLTEGRKEGLKEGRAEGLREAIEGVLQARFPGAVPEPLLATLRAQADVAALSNWLQLAATLSLDELRTSALDTGTGPQGA